MKNLSQNNQLSSEEIKMIEKFRMLDERGKRIIQNLIHVEYEDMMDRRSEENYKAVLRDIEENCPSGKN